MLTRVQATEKILAAKQAKGLTFAAIAEAVGRHKVWVTAALMGQATMAAEEANAAARMLGLDPEVAAALQEMPMKGSLDSAVPVDPLLYRFHEITQVYGTTIKALIHEMFGDGIMSERVASFVNLSNLLKSWDRTDIRQGRRSGVRGQKNTAITRILAHALPSRRTQWSDR